MTAALPGLALRFPLDVEATPDGGFVFIERDRVRHVDRRRDDLDASS